MGCSQLHLYLAVELVTGTPLNNLHCPRPGPLPRCQGVRHPALEAATPTRQACLRRRPKSSGTNKARPQRNGRLCRQLRSGRALQELQIVWVPAQELRAPRSPGKQELPGGLRVSLPNTLLGSAPAPRCGQWKPRLSPGSLIADRWGPRRVASALASGSSEYPAPRCGSGCPNWNERRTLTARPSGPKHRGRQVDEAEQRCRGELEVAVRYHSVSFSAGPPGLR